MVVRLLMATVADLKGWNRFYLLMNWPWSLLSTLVYFIASSTPMFLLGKVLEAFKESSYWAVSRTAIFSLSPNREAKASTSNIAVLSLGTAVGSAVVGLGIGTFGFTFIFGILIIAAGLIAIPAASLWKVPKHNFNSRKLQIGEILNLRRKGRFFWLASLTSVFFSLSFYPLLNLLLPVFMVQEIGYDYLTVGLAYMMYTFLASIVILGTLRFPIGIKRVIFQSSIALIATFLLASTSNYFLLLFVALSVADGLGTVFYESVIAKATKNNPNVSIDIGMLIVPLRFAEFGSVLYAGLIAQNIGYSPVFAASGIFFLIFSFLAFYLLKKT